MAHLMLLVKPYKLKPTSEATITRDDFVTWKYNLEASVRVPFHLKPIQHHIPTIIYAPEEISIPMLQ